MQRFTLVLAALTSMLIANSLPLLAQGADEPPTTPQRIDGKVVKGTETPTPTRDDITKAAQTHQGELVTVPSGETVESVFLQDRSLTLEGHVEHDVVAVNSYVVIKRGATVGGHVIAIGSNVENKAGDAVRVKNLTLSEGSVVLSHSSPSSGHVTSRGDFIGGQFALLLLGLVGGFVLLFVMPRGTQQTAALIALEPARCLVVGGIAAVSGLLVLTLNAGLMKSALGLVYAPFGAVIAIGLPVILACGWLCGMRWAGDIAARKFGKNDRGNLYARLALGLVAFFLLNSLLGMLHPWLGAVGLTFEFGVALMGLGAIVISGFGKNPDWLGSRMRGETRWFSWRR